jgi:hypothetical protein
MAIRRTSERPRGKRVWRYMSFGRFVWTLSKQALWMSRADQLGDAWEGILSEKELAVMVEKTVAAKIEERGNDEESGMAMRPDWTDVITATVATETKKQRERFFVNCWTASSSESHAMWSIYCASKEGIAIQTTLEKLRSSVGALPVLPVTYTNFVPKSVAKVHTRIDLVTRKRKPFSYEREERIVEEIVPPEKGSLSELIGFGRYQPLGYPLPWNPERWLDAVLVHPGADDGFFDAVKAVVEVMAPKLRRRVARSGMGALPPG